MISLNASLSSQNASWVPAAARNSATPREGDEASKTPATDGRSRSAAAENTGRPPSAQARQSVGDATPAQAAASQENPDVVRMLRDLEARDREVRTHEQAHKAAGGAYVTSGPSYVYQKGPDGQRYAVGGEVGIDTSPVEGDPQATIQKALTISRAALAPAQPSGQDLKVAQQAAQMLAQAQSDLLSQRMASARGETPDGQKAEQGATAQNTAAQGESAGQATQLGYRTQQASQAYAAMARLTPESASARWQAIA